MVGTRKALAVVGLALGLSALSTLSTMSSVSAWQRGAPATSAQGAGSPSAADVDTYRNTVERVFMTERGGTVPGMAACMNATRFMIKPQLGLFASLLIADLPDVKCWIVEGEAPAFLKFEGPLYFMGPVWRIEWI